MDMVCQWRCWWCCMQREPQDQRYRALSHRCNMDFTGKKSLGARYEQVTII